MRESSLEKSVVKWAKCRGVDSIKMEISSYVGLPDRLFLIPGGRPLFMELKRPGDTKGLRAIQRERINDLKHKGYDAVVCDNKDEAIFQLERRLDTARLSERRG